jgi:uncharacterized protein YbjT (DUF2867 family)
MGYDIGLAGCGPFMNPILIIGGTGQVGGHVVSQLTAAGRPVRALVRNPAAAQLPGEVDVVRGDLTVAKSLDAALDGIDTVFMVWTAPAAAAVPALERITRHARRMVYLSAPLKTPHPFFQQPNPGRVLAEQIERTIESSGVEWTFLRPGMFATNALEWWAPQIRAGDIIRWPYLDLPTAPIHTGDIAAVGVRALCDDGHAGAEYVITGPESLTHREQIETIGRAIGRPLRAEEISPDEARVELLAIFPPFLIELFLNVWAAAAGRPAFMTSTVEQVLARPARTFFEWATEVAPQWSGRRGLC